MHFPDVDITSGKSTSKRRRVPTGRDLKIYDGDVKRGRDGEQRPGFRTRRDWTYCSVKIPHLGRRWC